MKSPVAVRLLLVGVVAAGCRNDMTNVPRDVRQPTLALDREMEAAGPQFGDWSAPVNLGPPVNSAAVEQGASLSPDGLSLYFHCAGCPGTQGADIMVSHRDKVGDPWGAPQIVTVLSSAANDMAPFIAPDGRHLYFSSNRTGGFGGLDLWVSVRKDKHDDFAWETPVNLGPGVNSAADEAQASIFYVGDDDEDNDAGRTTVLFFARGPNGGNELYQSTAPPGGAFGNVTPLAELNTAAVERQPGVRRDGLELFFASDRTTTGDLDLWVATRNSTSDHWSNAHNLGSVVNSTGSIDARPTLSKDGTELYFQSTRPGGLGTQDLYVTTRRKGNK